MENEVNFPVISKYSGIVVTFTVSDVTEGMGAPKVWIVTTG